MKMIILIIALALIVLSGCEEKEITSCTEVDIPEELENEFNVVPNMKSTCRNINGSWKEESNELGCFWTPNALNNFYKPSCSAQSLIDLGRYCRQELKATWTCDPNGEISCKCEPTPTPLSAEGNISEPYVLERGGQAISITFNKCNEWRRSPKPIWETIGYNVTGDSARWANPVTEYERNTTFNISTQEICADVYYLEQCDIACEELGYEPYGRGTNPVEGITRCICKI